MKKLPGIESVRVSLNEGKTTMELKPGNSASIEQMRKAVTDQGFTPKDAKVTAIGNLAKSNGRLQFQVSGTSDVFPVMETPHAQWSKEAGRQVQVSGTIAAPPSPNAPSEIQITQVSPQNAADQKSGATQNK